MAIQSADVIRGNASLLVGRTRKRDDRRLSRHHVRDLHRIANGINIGL